MNKLNPKVNVMKNWIKRNRYKTWNSNDIWARIRRNWPSLSDEEAEYIFQKCWVVG